MCVMFLPEEICTLVIAEAFPEDGGLFCCNASNPYGSVNCTAHLTVTAGWYNKGDRWRGGSLKNHIKAPSRSIGSSGLNRPKQLQMCGVFW